MNEKIFNKLNKNLYVKLLCVFDCDLKNNIQYKIETILNNENIVINNYKIHNKTITFYCDNNIVLFDMNYQTLNIYDININKSCELF